MDIKLQQFRNELEHAYRGLEGHLLGRSIVAGLKRRFDNLFSEDTYRKTKAPKNTEELIKKYCFHDKSLCPICGSSIISKQGKYGTFYGCSTYPLCKGTRRHDGVIQTTYALIDFLNQAKKSEKSRSKENRFNTLEF